MSHVKYRTTAIFLKQENRAEADQLLTVFTKEFGKIAVLARGIRKVTSKLRPSAGLFYYSEVEFVQGKTQKTLTDALLIEKFNAIQQDPEKLKIALRLCRAVDCLLADQGPDERAWHLLKESFFNLNKANSQQELILHHFLWNFFKLLGFEPSLYACPLCQKKLLRETLFFVPEEGGVVCWRCVNKLKQKAGASHKIANVGAIQALRIFLKESQNVLKRLRVCPEDRDNLKHISEDYFAFLTNTLGNSQLRP